LSPGVKLQTSGPYGRPGLSNSMPRPAQCPGAGDDADEGVGLGIIPPQLARIQRGGLGKESCTRPTGEQALENGARFFRAALSMEGLDEPEGAEIEGCFRGAEVVRLDVAEQAVAVPQSTFDCSECGPRARIFCAQESEFGQLQQACIQFGAAKTGREMPRSFVPRLGFDARANVRGALTPENLPLRQRKGVRCIGEAVAGRPAQHGRIGVDAFAGPVLPQACVRLVIRLPCAFS